ncbi:U1 small nuclear ribonucleoprotein C [Collariella sp. IMI 366227]|nr:U1 small nuclear ribonucleoprotein C [Collariella sp. IMI 366227]
MPKFFCDYCDVYLTHDSMSVRKAHNSGRNHLRNVVDYYQQIGHEKAQSVIDSITSSYAAEGQAHANPMLLHNQPGGGGLGGLGAPPFGAFPPPMPGMPGGMPPPPHGLGPGSFPAHPAVSTPALRRHAARWNASSLPSSRRCTARQRRCTSLPATVSVPASRGWRESRGWCTAVPDVSACWPRWCWGRGGPPPFSRGVPAAWSAVPASTWGGRV